jgi:hypothetical protein
MNGASPSKCTACSTSLAGIPVEVTLTRQEPVLYCPLCGSRLGFYQPGRGGEPSRVFFDPDENVYRCWVDRALQEDIVEELRIGRFVIRVVCKPLNINECFFPRVFVFRTPDAVARRDPPHFSPVRPEFEHLIRKISLLNSSQSHRTWEVTTNTGWSAPVAVPCLEVTEIEGQDGAALYVWPDFVAAGWNRYYVTFNPPGIPTRLGTGNLHEVWTRSSPDAICERITSGAEVSGTEYNAVPARIVLRWIVDNCEYFGAWRCDLNENDVPHLRRITPVNAINVNLGFDVGTTNTAAAAFYGLPDDRMQPTNSLAVHDRTLRLLSGKVSPNIQWLPQPADRTKPLRTLPTQLLFESARRMQSPAANFTAPRQFTIPFYQSEDSSSEARSVGQFKWARALGPLAENASIYRQLYLRLSLELFLAEIVASEQIAPGPVSLVATYPLAFSPEDYKLHVDSFEWVRPALEAATGFRISLHAPLDESHAGQSCDIPIQPGRISFFMDVGGGTTDICLSNPERGAIFVVDSVQYGGEDLNDRVFDEKLTSYAPQEFRRKIRTAGALTFLTAENFSRDASKWQAANRIRAHLQRGLVECAARYVAAQAVASAGNTPEFHLYMLGLGWQTIFAHPEYDTPEKIAAAFRERINERVAQLHEAGIIGRKPALHCEYPPEPKSVVARGAARSTDPSRAPLDGSRRSYLLQDVRIITDRGQSTHPWTTPIPLRVGARITQLRRCDLGRFQFETLHQPPNGANWEAQKLEDCCVWRDTVEHSPFRLFLAEYKKGS